MSRKRFPILVTLKYVVKVVNSNNLFIFYFILYCIPFHIIFILYIILFYYILLFILYFISFYIIYYIYFIITFYFILYILIYLVSQIFRKIRFQFANFPPTSMISESVTRHSRVCTSIKMPHFVSWVSRTSYRGVLFS